MGPLQLSFPSLAQTSSYATGRAHVFLNQVIFECCTSFKLLIFVVTSGRDVPKSRSGTFLKSRYIFVIGGKFRVALICCLLHFKVFCYQINLRT